MFSKGQVSEWRVGRVSTVLLLKAFRRSQLFPSLRKMKLTGCKTGFVGTMKFIRRKNPFPESYLRARAISNGTKTSKGLCIVHGGR